MKTKKVIFVKLLSTKNSQLKDYRTLYQNGQLSPVNLNELFNSELLQAMNLYEYTCTKLSKCHVSTCMYCSY